jgi:hypothetical protein
MAHYVIKTLVTTLLVVLISEVAKRRSLAGAMLASVPIVSVRRLFRRRRPRAVSWLQSLGLRREI